MPLQYTDLLAFVQLVLPTLRVTRQRNLAWLVLGLVQVRDAHLTVSEIARAIQTRSNHWHKFKRMRRFLSNVKWSPPGCFPVLLPFLLSRVRTGAYLPVIIDQSTIARAVGSAVGLDPFSGPGLTLLLSPLHDRRTQG